MIFSTSLGRNDGNTTPVPPPPPPPVLPAKTRRLPHFFDMVTPIADAGGGTGDPNVIANMSCKNKPREPKKDIKAKRFCNFLLKKHKGERESADSSSHLSVAMPGVNEAEKRRALSLFFLVEKDVSYRQ